jgi:hypothetical protein
MSAVAEAILAVMEQHRPSRIHRGLISGDYEQCQSGCKYEPGDLGRYRRTSSNEQAYTAPTYRNTSKGA